MQYKNFERAEMLHTRIENITDRIKQLHEAIQAPHYYHLRLEYKVSEREPIDFFSDDEDPYIREIATRYVAELEDERVKLIKEFEALE